MPRNESSPEPQRMRAQRGARLWAALDLRLGPCLGGPMREVTSMCIRPGVELATRGFVHSRLPEVGVAGGGAR